MPLSPDAMRELASRLDDEARSLRNDARRAEERAAGRERQRARDRLIRHHAMRAARGAPDRDIIAGMMADLDLGEGDARALLAHERARSKRTLKARRDRDILRQAWSGKTNAEIARRFGLSEKHVSRIVAGRLGAMELNWGN